VKLKEFFTSRFNLTGNQKKIFKNVSWAVLGKIVNILSGLFVGILVARYLGPKDYGLMNYVISYVTLFSILANFGLDNIEIRELSKRKVNKEAILGTAFRLRLFFSVITIILISFTLLLFESDRFTVLMVLIYSSSLILSTLNVIRNYFTSIVLNEYVVKTEITRTLAGALIKIILLYYHFSLGWFIAASAFDFLLVAGGYLYSYRIKVGSVLDWKYENKIAKHLLRESFPLLLSGTAIIIYQKIDQVMIRNMIDNAAVGQFAVAAKITELAIFIPMVIAQTVTPLLVKAHQENMELYKRKRQQFMDMMIWIAIGMSIIMFIAASPAIKILFGVKYLDAIPVLQIMAWKTVFVALFVSSGQIIIIENIQKYAVLRNIAGCFISIIFNLILIPRYGILGSALATIFTMSFTGYFSHIFISPFRFLFHMQSNSLVFGLMRVVRHKF
jgi:O-antigen/teichoic acid export membrane protein